MKHLRKNRTTAGLRAELQIDRVPAAVERKLKQVYAELPMDMPEPQKAPAWKREEYEQVEAVTVKRWPWPVRAGLAAGGTVLAAAVLLMGLNLSYPQFTESLPGLGGIFEKVNKSWKNPMGSNLNTYADLEQVSQGALAQVDSGYELTVDEAFCDGENVYFTTELRCPPEAAQYESIVFYKYGGRFEMFENREDSPEDYEDCQFTINGTVTDIISQGSTWSPEEGVLSAAYVMPVQGGQAVEDGQVLPVTLSISTLECHYGKESDRRLTPDLIPVGFETEFAVTVNKKHNRINVGKGQDNSVSVKEVESTPGYIKLKLEMPVFGYVGEEEMQVSGTPKGGPDACRLYTEDGQELMRNQKLVEMDSRLEVVGPNPVYPAKGTMINYTVGFDGVPEGCKKVKLRVFEVDPLTGILGKVETSEDIHDLFAELTIDLETGSAEATDTYLQEGIKKLDAEEYINTPHTPLFTGGYLLTNEIVGPDYTGWENQVMEGWSMTVDMFADTEEAPDLTMRFWMNGEQIGEVKSRAPEACTQPDDRVESYEYEQEDGSRFHVARYTGTSLENLGFQTIPKWQMSFVMHRDGKWEETANLPVEEQHIVVQVIDNKTGEVIFDDPQMYTTWVPQMAGAAENRNPADAPVMPGEGGAESDAASSIAELPNPGTGVESMP